MSFSCRTNKEEDAGGLQNIQFWIDSARNNDIDSAAQKTALFKALKNIKNRQDDSLKLKYYSRIQWTYLKLRDSLLFRETNKEAMRLATSLDNKERLANAHWDLALYFNNKNVKDSSYFHYAKAKDLFISMDEKAKAAQLLRYMATIQSDIKDYTGSEINTIQSVAFFKSLDNNIELYKCYNLLGTIAKDLGEYKRALDYFNQASGFLDNEKLSNTGYHKELHNNMAVLFQKQKKHKKAIKVFESILESKYYIKENPKFHARVINNLAINKYKINLNDSTVDILFKKSLAMRKAVNDLTGLAGSYYSLAEYQLARNDSTKALQYARKANIYARKSQNQERLIQTIELLTSIDQKNATQYAQEYFKITKKLQIEERTIKDKFARIKFETDEVVAQNQILRKERLLWTYIAFFIILLGISGYIIINQRRKNQKLRFEQVQQESNEKIFSLMLSEKQKLEEGKKLEQQRISEELHDGILGKLLGARMVLTGLNKQHSIEAIEERALAIAELKGIEEEIRLISHELNFSAFILLNNFMLSFLDLVENTCKAAQLKHTIDYDKNIDWDKIPIKIKINIYRITQEILQNSVKHSQCKNLLVILVKENKKIKIEVSDDGIGFNKKNKNKGIGLKNIASRLFKINGSWIIDTAPGKGSKIIFFVPDAPAKI